jgi:hypothetical protein
MSNFVCDDTYLTATRLTFKVNVLAAGTAQAVSGMFLLLKCLHVGSLRS